MPDDRTEACEEYTDPELEVGKFTELVRFRKLGFHRLKKKKPKSKRNRKSKIKNRKS